jgi:SAM-dependent methyltransferase
MELSDDEAQVLAILAAEAGAGPIALEAIERAGERYWMFKGDYDKALSSLSERGLIIQSPDGLGLTAEGAPIAAELNRERPDMYFYYYREFYPRAWASEAHSELCRRAFGRDLCQEGMTDMVALEWMLDRLDLKPGQRVLDLGCGAGGIANYISESRDVHVTGIDNAKPAIAQAQKIFGSHADRLTFIEADMNDLQLDDRFDAALAIDVLYWVADMGHTVSAISNLLRPGGQMGVIMTHTHKNDEGPGRIPPEATKFGKAATELGLPFEAIDLTEHNHAFWRRNYEAAKDLMSDFEAEGNAFIAASLIREAEEDFLPFFAEGRISRYLFHVRGIEASESDH